MTYIKLFTYSYFGAFKYTPIPESKAGMPSTEKTTEKTNVNSKYFETVQISNRIVPTTTMR